MTQRYQISITMRKPTLALISSAGMRPDPEHQFYITKAYPWNASIFYSCRTEIFQMNFFTMLSKELIICTQKNHLSNVVLMSTHIQYFEGKIIEMYSIVHPSFTTLKLG